MTKHTFQIPAGKNGKGKPTTIPIIIRELDTFEVIELAKMAGSAKNVVAIHVEEKALKRAECLLQYGDLKVGPDLPASEVLTRMPAQHAGYLDLAIDSIHDVPAAEVESFLLSRQPSA